MNKLLVGLVALLAVVTMTTPALAIEDGWLDLAYDQRALATIDSSLITGSADSTLVNFPVLLSFTSADSAIFTDANAHGSDLAFTTDDGVTLIQHEVVSWDKSGETGEVWLQFPSLQETNNQFYIYFDNASFTTRRNPNSNKAAWGPKWRTVLHFENDPRNNVAFDATPLQSYARWRNNAANAPFDSSHIATGKIGNAWTLSAARGLINETLEVRGSSWTMQAWLKHSDDGTDFLAQWNSCYAHISTQASTASNDLQFEEGYCATNGIDARNNNGIALDNWTLFTFVYNRDTPYVTAYVDSSKVFWTAFTDNGDSTFYGNYDILTANASSDRRMGILGPMWSIDTDIDGFDGVADEFTVYAGAMSANWISTYYNMTNNNAAWWSVAAEQADTAVVVTDITCGTEGTVIVEGGSNVITGANMGTYTIDIDFFGDNIDNGNNANTIDEVADPNTWHTGFSTDVQPPLIDSSVFWSAPNSIDSSIDRTLSPSNHQRVVQYYKEAGFDKIYATWMVLWSPQSIGTFCQWKHWYMGTTDHHSTCGSVTSTSRYTMSGGTASIGEFQSGFVCCTNGCELLTSECCSGRYCYSELVPEPFYESEFPPSGWWYKYHNHAGDVTYKSNHPGQNQWTKIELYADASTPGAFDGRWEYYITIDGATRHHVDTWTNLMTFNDLCSYGDSERGPWQYFGVQGYQDDNGGTGQEVVDLHYDDIYIQFGHQARVELGNASTWAACTRREPQVATAWTDASITYTTNLGAFGNSGTAATLYVYVIGPDGEPLDTTGLTVTTLGKGRGHNHRGKTQIQY